MPTVTYPSDVVPGPPRIALEIPEGWEQVWTPETLVAVREAGATDHFAPNAVVRFFQRVGTFGPDDIEREMREYAGRQRDGEVGPVKSQTINGREWIGIDVAFVDEQAGTIAQLHWFTAQQQNDVVDVLQATASFAASRKESDYPVLDALVDSIRVNP
ncbi:hypothetical protein [Janibacter sp. UYMM211]|uniref:hypothetical protein n=1 Tax=Janibacter TaxID=53457 RepID=UPI00177CB022|nr:hypothetical protein [Janibacter melonis]